MKYNFECESKPTQVLYFADLEPGDMFILAENVNAIGGLLKCENHIFIKTLSMTLIDNQGKQFNAITLTSAMPVNVKNNMLVSKLRTPITFYKDDFTSVKE